MNASRLRCIARRLVKYRRRNSIRQCSCRIVPCRRSTKPLVQAWRGKVRVCLMPRTRHASAKAPLNSEPPSVMRATCSSRLASHDSLVAPPLVLVEPDADVPSLFQDLSYARAKFSDEEALDLHLSAFLRHPPRAKKQPDGTEDRRLRPDAAVGRRGPRRRWPVPDRPDFGRSVKVEFALEAKCYGLDHPVGVEDTSRLISRLRFRQFGYW